MSSIQTPLVDCLGILRDYHQWAVNPVLIQPVFHRIAFRLGNIVVTNQNTISVTILTPLPKHPTHHTCSYWSLSSSLLTNQLYQSTIRNVPREPFVMRSVSVAWSNWSWLRPPVPGWCCVPGSHYPTSTKTSKQPPSQPTSQPTNQRFDVETSTRLSMPCRAEVLGWRSRNLWSISLRRVRRPGRLKLAKWSAPDELGAE